MRGPIDPRVPPVLAREVMLHRAQGCGICRAMPLLGEKRPRQKSRPWKKRPRPPERPATSTFLCFTCGATSYDIICPKCLDADRVVTQRYFELETVDSPQGSSLLRPLRDHGLPLPILRQLRQIDNAFQLEDAARWTGAMDDMIGVKWKDDPRRGWANPRATRICPKHPDAPRRKLLIRRHGAHIATSYRCTVCYEIKWREQYAKKFLQRDLALGRLAAWVLTA